MKKLMLTLVFMQGVSLQAFDIPSRMKQHTDLISTIDSHIQQKSLHSMIYHTWSELMKFLFFPYNASNLEKIEGSPEALEDFRKYAAVNLEGALAGQTMSYAALCGGLIAAINKKVGNTIKSGRVALSATGLAALSIPLIQNHVYAKDIAVPYYGFSSLQRRDNLFGCTDTLARQIFALAAALTSYVCTDYVLNKIVNKYTHSEKVSQEEFALYVEQYLLEKPAVLLYALQEAESRSQSLDQYFKERPDIVAYIYQEAGALYTAKQMMK